MRAPSMTVTVVPRDEVMASPRVAETTTCSRTGAGSSTRSIDRVLAGFEAQLRLGREDEAGGVELHGVVAGLEAGQAEAAVGTGGEGVRTARTVHVQRDLGHRRSLGGANDAGQRLAGGPGGRRAGKEREREKSEREQRRTAHGESPGRRLDAGENQKLLHARRPQQRFAQGRFPGSRVVASPPTFPGTRPSGSSSSERDVEAGSPATVAGPRRFSTCFPFNPSKRGAP